MQIVKRLKTLIVGKARDIAQVSYLTIILTYWIIISSIPIYNLALVINACNSLKLILINRLFWVISAWLLDFFLNACFMLSFVLRVTSFTNIFAKSNISCVKYQIFSKIQLIKERFMSSELSQVVHEVTWNFKQNLLMNIYSW